MPWVGIGQDFLQTDATKLEILFCPLRGFDGSGWATFQFDKETVFQWAQVDSRQVSQWERQTLALCVCGHWQRNAVIQAVGHCCLDGYGAQGVVWSNPDTRKATARYLCICPTTQPLCQGAGNAGKMRPELSFASGATNLHLKRKVASSNPARTLPLFTSSILR